ncbi:hypothetical protein EYF80_063948 [Liparis tanakae]|uniref:Uncharacterized protein n=1 Tax=Liparis tanakae TaxID=230148 RepID=A0A4Z2EAP9_9TELE|nr:hypothetical protein EYF80_063948 [Liparis tanakae]
MFGEEELGMRKTEPSAAPAVCRTGRLQDRPSAGPAVCRTGRLQDRPSAGPAVCRTVRLQDRPSAGPAVLVGSRLKQKEKSSTIRVRLPLTPSAAATTHEQQPRDHRPTGPRHKEPSVLWRQQYTG